MVKDGLKILLLVWAVSLIPFYVIAFMAPAVGFFHDDGIYAVTAKALAEGKGYRIISLPGDVPQTKYPPLFPLLLAAVWKLFPAFPQNAYLLKLVPLAAGIAWLWLTYVLLKRETGSQVLAAAITLVVASAAWTVFLSNVLLAETLFAALATGSLLLLRQFE